MLARRTPDGGYCFYRTPRWGVEEPNAPDTLAALESLRLLRVAAPAPELTGCWLRGLQSNDGGYQTLTIGWAALRALDLLGTDPDSPPQEWLRSCLPTTLNLVRTDDWRGALVNALRLLELVHLLGLELDADQRQVFAGMLAAAADESGGWVRPGADLEMTAVAVRVITLLGLPGEREAATADFLHRCEDAVFGLRLTPGTAATSIGALRGGLSMAWALNVPLRSSHAIGRSIARLQRPSGGFGARDGAIPTLRDTWLGLHAACMLKHRFLRYLQRSDEARSERGHPLMASRSSSTGGPHAIPLRCTGRAIW